MPLGTLGSLSTGMEVTDRGKRPAADQGTATGKTIRVTPLGAGAGCAGRGAQLAYAGRARCAAKGARGIHKIPTTMHAPMH